MNDPTRQTSKFVWLIESCLDIPAPCRACQGTKAIFPSFSGKCWNTQTANADTPCTDSALVPVLLLWPDTFRN